MVTLGRSYTVNADGVNYFGILFSNRFYMGKSVLGLDLGTSSIGWALIEEGDERTHSRLIDTGVRIFTEGLDAFDTGKESSRNENRRVARGMRRQTARRVRRRKLLTNGLIEAGLWPVASEEQKELLSLDPYELRFRAIDANQRLKPFELGRIFLALSRRRGFQSNRKSDKTDNEVDGLLKEIAINEQSAAGSETLGAWLHKKHESMDHRNRTEDDHVRKRHLSRKQYRDEFAKIWEIQKIIHPDLFNDKLRFGEEGPSVYPCKPKSRDQSKITLLRQFGIEGLVFFQRRMYWNTSIIGKCELEPKKKRCPLADRRYQRFRIWQDVNNLRYIDPETGAPTSLNIPQRTVVFNRLWQSEQIEFNALRKLLGFAATVRFNLERGERGHIKGNRTDHILSNKKIFGSGWHDIEEQSKDDIVAALTDPNLDENEFSATATEKWKFSPTAIDRLLSARLPVGYGSLSLKAILRLLPHVERGLVYSTSKPEESALHAAGYLRRDQLKKRLYDRLPSPQLERTTPIGDISNPVVKRALSEVRKLVNAIIREFGKPDAVHVEMARSLQMGAQKRKEMNQANAKREKERSSIAEELRNNLINPTRANIQRYVLWQEQNRECMYSDPPRSISLHQLFSDQGGIEVDHILPRSRTLDDSHSNKVLCFRVANADKLDRTPYEWLAASSHDRYQAMLTRANRLVQSGTLSYGKYCKLSLKELAPDDFVARQLVDTAYITKATVEYLKCLFDKDHQVLGLKGRLTAELRWQWVLDTILSELPDSPAWSEGSDLRAGEKNRSDHRHHAIDAIVIALTNRSRLQRLAANLRTGYQNTGGELLPTPWPTFRHDVSDRISQVWVSRRVERKIHGPLHEETHYGKTEMKDVWVVRKPLVSLTANEVGDIRDATIRQRVQSELAKHGIVTGRKADVDKKKMQTVLAEMTMPSGVPIKRVRITKKQKATIEIRSTKSSAYVEPGKIHHLCLFEWDTPKGEKRGASFVTMIEAARRAKSGETIVSKLPLNNSEIDLNAKFLMSLSNGEYVLKETIGGNRLLVLRRSGSTSCQMFFADHADARKEYKETSFKPSTFVGRKVTVDLLGRIRDARD